MTIQFKFDFFILIAFCIFFHSCSKDECPIKPTYDDLRESWIIENGKLNFSHKIVLNDNEKKLDAYIKKLVVELKNEFLTSSQFYPAQLFSDSKFKIEATELFQLLKSMPKGGMLHIHVFATGDAARLIQMACSYNDTYIYLSNDGAFLIGSMAVYSEGKVPSGFYSMKEQAKKDPLFIPKVVEMITLTTQDASSSNPWNKFNDCFHRLNNLFNSQPLFIEFYTDAFSSLAEDGIDFVELRTTFSRVLDQNGMPLSKNDIVGVFRFILQQVRKKYPNFNLKLIISDLRSETIEEVYSLLEEAFQLRANNKDLVVGYDLVGFETIGHTTAYYLDNWIAACSRFEEKYGVELPYFFHDGESNWGNDDNLYDAILLNTKRIGHGFNLFFFPWLQKQIKKQDICLEICPISNQMLGYIRDLRLHPAIGFLKQGIPCVLSSDDPLIFRTSGLTYDLWEAVAAWQLSIADIKQLFLNSIIYSALDEEEKKEALSHWEIAWSQYIQAFVESHLAL